MKHLRRILIASGAVAALSTGLIGFAHTKAGRPLLALLTGAPGCPVNLNNVDPKTAEAFRVKQMVSGAGVKLPASRPAFAFELGKSTRSDVQAWATREGVKCDAVRQNSVLQCRDFPSQEVAAPEPRVEDAHLQFDAKDRLVAIDLFRKSAGAGDSVRYLDALASELTSKVGEPTRLYGKRTAKYVAAKAFRSAGAEYRYSDYIAQVSVVNYSGRIRVREQYQWLPPTDPA